MSFKIIFYELDAKRKMLKVFEKKGFKSEQKAMDYGFNTKEKHTDYFEVEDENATKEEIE